MDAGAGGDAYCSPDDAGVSSESGMGEAPRLSGSGVGGGAAGSTTSGMVAMRRIAGASGMGGKDGTAAR